MLDMESHTKTRQWISTYQDLFWGQIGPKYLNLAWVWGCTANVLHPTLQDDKKLPKWDPHSKQGKFLGFFQDHALTAGLILNLQTGRVTRQFHVLYDDWFETASNENQLVEVGNQGVWERLF